MNHRRPARTFRFSAWSPPAGLFFHVRLRLQVQLAQLSRLHSAGFDSAQARYSFVAANPFLAFRSIGSQCEISKPGTPDSEPQTQFGNPWHLLDALMARYELLDEIDLPFRSAAVSVTGDTT